MKKTIVFCMMLLGGIHLGAQTSKTPEMPDLWREMENMQKQLMQQFRNLSPSHNLEWDTTYSFRIDTFLNGDGFNGRFFFSPFGRDTSILSDFFNFDPFSDDLDAFFRPFQWAIPENDENSALEDRQDGLLPEERLRMEESVPETPPAIPQAPETPLSKKPKIRTIRI